MGLSGEKYKNRGTQRNKKVWNAKNKVMMIKVEPKRTRIERTMQYGSFKLFDVVKMCKSRKLFSKKWSTKLLLQDVFSNRNEFQYDLLE